MVAGGWATDTSIVVLLLVVIVVVVVVIYDVVGVAVRDWATHSERKRLSVVPPPSWGASFCGSRISFPFGYSGPGRNMIGVHWGNF